MKQFKLQEYLQLKAEGKEPRLRTRDGRSARIICTDADAPDFPIVALCKIGGECESLMRYQNNGEYSRGGVTEFDLFFADEEEKPKNDFKPFDKVLVRDSYNAEWIPDIFFKCGEGLDGELAFFTIGNGYWRYCIQYEGNEELVGTTNAPKK